MNGPELGDGQLLGAIVALVGGFWAVVKFSLWQFEKRLTERFATQELARVEAKKDWDSRFGALDRGQRSLERDFLGLKAELPVNYVRREDAVREQTIINAKLDAVALRLDTYFKREGT